MSYGHTSLTQFKQQLANRLGDSLMVHWVSDELGMCTIEALRTWGLLTGFWRERGIFSTSVGVPFYDINTLASMAALTGYAVTDADTIGLMQYMLTEPKSPTGAGMSQQYAFNDLVLALQRARNQLIQDSLVTVEQRSIFVPAGSASVSLPDSVISIRRAVWKSVDGVYSNVHWSDEIEAASYAQLYPLSPATPEMYSILSAPPLTLHLIPPPADDGTLELITAETQVDLNPSAPVLMSIPDDTVWIARELALADILGRDGAGHDPARAAYARKRYELGIALISQMAQIVFVEFGGVPVIPSGVAEIDFMYASPHWQSAGMGAPTDLGIIASNMVALRRVPDVGPSGSGYSIGLDVVRKAVIPQLVGVDFPSPDGSDYIQVPREDLSALLDGAQSYAVFKLGGGDLTEANRLATSMMTAAARYNARLSTLGYNARSQQQSRANEQSMPETGTGLGEGSLDSATMQRSGGGDQ